MDLEKEDIPSTSLAGSKGAELKGSLQSQAVGEGPM